MRLDVKPYASLTQLPVHLFTLVGQVRNGKVHYNSFTLNNQTYSVGDCVFLFPEDESYPPYIARILSAFVDQEVTGTDPHCIEAGLPGTADCTPTCNCVDIPSGMRPCHLGGLGRMRFAAVLVDVPCH